MRVDPDPEGARHVGDLLAFGNAAGGAHIGLQDVDEALGHKRPKAPAGELGLAAGDRDLERGLDRAVSGEVFGRHRLFEPGNVERLDPPAEMDRRGCIKAWFASTMIAMPSPI